MIIKLFKDLHLKYKNEKKRMHFYWLYING